MKPLRHATTQSFVVSGRVSYDQNKISNISARVSGRIEELYVQYQYQPIKKGQKLLTLYSRELETEQENYLYVLRNEPANTTLIESIENRLHLLGVTMEQRATLVSSNKASRSVVVRSPADGHVHQAVSEENNVMANQDTRNYTGIRTGSFVSKNQTLFKVYQTDRVWLLLDVPTEYQSLITVGLRVSITFQGRSNDTVKSVIQFVEPAQRSGRPFITARVSLDNHSGRLKIGTLATAKMYSESGNQLFVPSSSVVSLGRTSVVFVKVGSNVFEAHTVVPGQTMGDEVSISTGLTGDETIAVHAQMLVDSESIIRSEK
ncbi:MAG TPA: efflux RND transporter periplasmic adaptor subunit [Candidatus Didemnitutus sp.]|nr:efflux RND transporter periplasmic adaptor subunit [Candidatus Didemnitutus sp.]